MNDKQELHGNDGKKGNDESHHSPSSHKSRPDQNQRPIFPPRGDYQTLLSWQKAEVVYDITFRFAHKFLSKGDRTVDQMIQSARSCKQNILEGSKAATTSKETEIKLTNVGRASLEELLADYLLDQQLKTLEKEFVEQGGLRERMTKARLNDRNQRPQQ
jgi:four helix bundle suffix protein